MAWEWVLSLDVKRVFHLTEFVLQLLGTCSYSSSKAAVPMLTRHLAAARSPPRRPTRASACPTTTWPGTAVFLGSRAGAYPTGTVIPVDGGRSIAG